MKTRTIYAHIIFATVLGIYSPAHALTFANNNEGLNVDLLVFTKSSHAMAYLRALGWTNKVQGELMNPLLPVMLISAIGGGPAVLLLSLPTWALIGGGPTTRAVLKKTLATFIHEKIAYEESVTISWEDIRKKSQNIEQIRVLVFDNKTGAFLASGKCGIQADIGFYGIGNMVFYYIFKDDQGKQQLLSEKEGRAHNWKIVKPWEHE